MQEQLALDWSGAAAAAAAPPARRLHTAPGVDEVQDDENDGQLTLVKGTPERRRRVLDAAGWQRLLDHLPTVTRYRAKVAQFGHDDCWPWLGAISSSGHGKLRAGPGAATVVTAHVLGYQLAYGVVSGRADHDLVVAHRCDEPSCQQPAHWDLVTRAINSDQYQARRGRLNGPLADERGPHGRAVALRAAILDARRTGGNAQAALAEAMAAGLRRTDGLF